MPESAYRSCEGTVLEMSCDLHDYKKLAQNFMCPGPGNVPEILPYTAPGKVKEMLKFPGVGNVHAMNNKCELSCTFLGIS